MTLNIVRDVRGALLLRAWAFDVLTGRGVSPCPAASPKAWSLFLEGERCALPLQRRLRADERLSAIPPDRREQFDARVAQEQAHVEAARRDLRNVAAIGSRTDLKVVVFKGAAAALGDETAVDLEDVDVWVAPGDLDRMLGEMSSVGYPAPSYPGGVRHAPPLESRDGLRVEVHFTLDTFERGEFAGAWERCRPCENYPGLWEMSAADHLWLMLLHVTLIHPNRRSNLRELVLLAGARTQDGDAVGDVRRRIDHHWGGTVLRTVFNATDFANRDAAAESVLNWDAAGTLAIRRLLGGLRLPRSLESWSYYLAFAMLLGGHAWDRLRNRWREPCSRKWVRELRHRSRLLGRIVCRAGRVVAVAVATLIAFPTAALARAVRSRSTRPT